MKALSALWFRAFEHLRRAPVPELPAGAQLATLPSPTLESPGTRQRILKLALAAIGVVYGDIGTSPLYALRECFHGQHRVSVTEGNVLGVLSLVFWSLVLIVSLKYLALVMRADNDGEGGILALLSIIARGSGKDTSARRRALVMALGVFGAALLYGDGMITPAISVLSAVEGLKTVTPHLEPFIVPVTVAVLAGLFAVQCHGSGKVGRVFGPVMVVWFITIAVLGLRQVLRAPAVCAAVDPRWAGQFFAENGYRGFLVLGAVFLVVTGSEALYADMGHFGRRPIRLAWSSLVFPALILNYFGQGALLLQDGRAAADPFYGLCPRFALIPVVLLATLATVIASQALISGAFSLTLHAIQLGYSPRMRIEHTSSAERGQIYIPEVNWLLMVTCICLVLGFGSSSHLAAAYGIAVTLTMVITTFLFCLAAQRRWGWSQALAWSVAGGFLILELTFFGANAVKIAHGGWFPLVVGLVIFTLMTTWRTGRQILAQRLQESALPLDLFLAEIAGQSKVARVEGTAVFLSGRVDGTPLALLHNIKHNKVLHERVVLLTISPETHPHVPPAERITTADLGHGFYRVVARLGYMDEPHVPSLLSQCREHGLTLNPQEVTYFLSRETILPSRRPGMALWREKLFAVQARNAQSATAFFRLPANRVVELGMHVEI